MEGYEVSDRVVSSAGDPLNNIIGYSSKPIEVWNPKVDHYEQSSENIWSQTVQAITEAIKLSQVDVKDIISIVFDATCSL